MRAIKASFIFLKMFLSREVRRILESCCVMCCRLPYSSGHYVSKKARTIPLGLTPK
jgi:hypothetical protein